MCTHCGKIGHTIEVCYRNHGFPPHFGKGSKANNVLSSENDDGNSASTQQQADKNGSTSITQEQFDKLVNLLLNSAINQGSSSTVSNQVGLSSFTGHTLVNAIGNHHSFIYDYSALDSWIIDSGASDHTCI